MDLNDHTAYVPWKKVVLAGGFAHKRAIRLLYRARALTELLVIRFILSPHELQTAKGILRYPYGPCTHTYTTPVWTLTSFESHRMDPVRAQYEYSNSAYRSAVL